jgi:hypothetical protein
MEVYQPPFEDGEFLAAIHHKLSVMHEGDEYESTYPPIQPTELDFHSKFGDLSLELDNITPPKSPSAVSLQNTIPSSTSFHATPLS